MPAGKRDLLARSLCWSGAAFLLSQLPARDMLLVLNYHRIGDPNDDLFDPGVFSATADEFNEQIGHLKKHVPLVTLEEALAYVKGTVQEKPRKPRCRVLITFDDGYLDNHKIAFPILRSHGVQGVFFLITEMVGSCRVPWWDHIAYVMRTARRRRFTLRYPCHLEVDIDEKGMTQSLRDVLSLYKKPANTEPARFLQELTEAAKGEVPPASNRRFLDWDEAREMIAAGMAIGSHTHRHHVLSQLDREEQRQELARSRERLHVELGTEVEVLAYPVGNVHSFSDQTEQLAAETGYRAAFSFYGGTNRFGLTKPYDIRRIGVENPVFDRFRVQGAVCRITGSYWP